MILLPFHQAKELKPSNKPLEWRLAISQGADARLFAAALNYDKDVTPPANIRKRVFGSFIFKSKKEVSLMVQHRLDVIL